MNTKHDMKEDQELAFSLLENETSLQLATVQGNQMPRIRTVHFLFKNKKLYIQTFKTTDKIAQLENNNKVGFLINVAPIQNIQSVEELTQTYYLRGNGKSKIIQALEENQEIMNGLKEKIPMLQELPLNAENMYCIEIEVNQLTLFNNQQGFGYTANITL